MHYSIFYHCGSIDSLSVETQEGTFYQAKGLLDAFYSIVLSVSNIFSQTPLTRLPPGPGGGPNARQTVRRPAEPRRDLGLILAAAIYRVPIIR